MSLDVKCNKCGRDLEKPGGLLFGPPQEGGWCHKLHLCIDCYREVAWAITGLFPMVD